MKTVAVVSVIASIVLAASITVIYLNFTAFIQQQSDLIKEQANENQNLREAIDNLIYEINNLWNNADLPDIRTNMTAQTFCFQLPD